MSPTRTPSLPEAGRHQEWVEGWAEAVRDSPLAIGLLDLDTMAFVAMSAQTADLLGTTLDDGVGLDYISLLEELADAPQIMALLRSGALDGVEGRRRLRRLDGSVIEVLSCGRAIRQEGGPCLALWVALDMVTQEDSPAVTADVLAALPNQLLSLEPVLLHPAFGTVDHHWRIAQLSTDVTELLGHPAADLVGSSILDLTHPADIGALLLAFAQATSGIHAAVRVRMRHRFQSWLAVSAVVTRLNDKTSTPFGFVLGADAEPDATAERQRVAELERRLQHIGEEVQAAGVDRVLGPVADTVRVPALSELTARQWEVISRLANGERVSTIASELYLSESTVRNHLSAAFRKLGVHSQRGLLALLQRD